MLRPLQDCYKIHQWAHKNYKVDEVRVLNNMESIHTEYNVTLHFPLSLLQDLEIDSKYIGIAKLCCGFCHKYLDMEGYEHRGMYLSPFQEIFKKEVLKITEGKEIFQHRRLSFDDFEKDIPPQLQDCINLAELKAILV